MGDTAVQSRIHMGNVSLMTDLYQITMCYGYWKCGKHKDTAVFDLFFRRNPFDGEYTVFCGLADCLEIVKQFRFTQTDIDYIRCILPESTEPEFFEYLKSLDCSAVKIYAVDEGEVVFPKVPLLTIEGPLAIAQLLETILLNTVNFASLVCTNAVRFRLAAGSSSTLLEFGLRRAQGPNGAMSASKYCYIGGFDATSNVLAGKEYGIPVKGTHAHSFVNSFENLTEIKPQHRLLKKREGSNDSVDFVAACVDHRSKLLQYFPKVKSDELTDGELAAFCMYATAFPKAFLALIDTYDVLKCGVLNFCACALALHDLGYRAVGVRIDSGDLAYLSREVRKTFKLVGEKYQLDWFGSLAIVASNDINEETIYSLQRQGHEINSFGVGTHLVTCQKQPALGCVFKLVSINSEPRIKLSQDVAKITIPGKKHVYRLYGKDGMAINDVLMLHDEPGPSVGDSLLCRHPFQENKRVFVRPSHVESLQKLVWDCGKLLVHLPTLEEVRHKVRSSVAALREDHRRNLNPTPYKVSVSGSLYSFMHELWLKHAPISQLE